MMNKYFIRILILLLFITLLYAEKEEVKLGKVISPKELKILKRINLTNAVGIANWVSQRAARNESAAGAQTVIAGSSEEEKLTEYLTEQLTKLGYKVSEERFPALMYSYEKCNLRFGGKKITGYIYGDSPGTMGTYIGKKYRKGNFSSGEKIVGDLVNIGRGTKEEISRVGSINQKVVLIKRDDSVTYFPRAAIQEAYEEGAIAAILYGYSKDSIEVDAIRQDSIQSPIPAITISKTSAQYIQKELAAGITRIDIESLVKINQSKGRNLVAISRGKQIPDEYIIIGAHLDRWFEGCHKSAAGIAALLELARLFRPGYYDNNRSIAFVIFSGHETAGPGSFVNYNAGSADFIYKHSEVRKNGIIYLNLSSIGGRSKTGYLNTDMLINNYFKEIYTDLELLGKYDLISEIKPKSDAYIFWAKAGVPTLDLFRMGSETLTDNTNKDILEELSEFNYLADIKIAALTLYRFDNKISLPYKLSTFTKWLIDKISDANAYIVNSSHKQMDSLTAQLKLLHKNLSKFETIMEKTFPKAELGNIITTEKYDKNLYAWAVDFNMTMRKLSNQLIPESLSSCGHYPYESSCAYIEQELNDIANLKKVAYHLKIDDVKGAKAFLEKIPTLGWGKLFSKKTYLTLRTWMDTRTSFWYNETRGKQYFLPVELFDLYEKLNQFTGIQTPLKSKGEAFKNEINQLLAFTKILNETIAKKNENFEIVVKNCNSILDEFFIKYKDKFEAKKAWETYN
ncbi:MAG: M28 family metallopeptidase [Pseudomonadota bacterium]